MRSIASATLLLCLAFPAAGQMPTEQRPARHDRMRLAEVFRLAEGVRARIWPGWELTPLSVLLVTDSAEFLTGHPRPDGDFAPLGYDTLLAKEVLSRPRRLPSNLLATFPAVGGLPTIVVGTAERTGLSSTSWVTTLLHEHFHQWQASLPGYYAGVAALDLARGDSTGRWMLDYPFPYDSVTAQRAVRSLARELARALASPGEDRAEAVKGVIAARDALRSALSSSDWRSLEFQLWQEGTARFVERAVAREASRSGTPSAEFQGLPDYEPYAEAAADHHERLRAQLLELDLGAQERLAFYPLGDAIARLLERVRPDWRQTYAERPFALAALLR